MDSYDSKTNSMLIQNTSFNERVPKINGFNAKIKTVSNSN